MNKNKRTSGILLPIFSLPSPHGIGTLGKAAFDFVDFLKNCHVGIWQMLPLNPTSYGDSPYQSFSGNGLNYYFIDLDILVGKKLLKEEEIDDGKFFWSSERIDYSRLFENRLPLLRKAFGRFDCSNKEFQSFVREGKYNDFAFYMTLKTKFGFRPWYEWPEEYRFYSFSVEDQVKRKQGNDYLFFLWTQYEFLNQYQALKKYANSCGIQIMGDMPLYLARDSVEVYKYPKMFLLDKRRNPTLVAGCPPDYFSKDGQLWGNPIYDWKEMEKNGYTWFHQRIQDNLETFDILRIDHFRGLSSYYVIPFGLQTARVGQWREGPGMKLFEGYTDLPIVAEDLGILDDGVKKLLKETGFPGMKILEFAFDGDDENEYLPSNSSKNYVMYTGTHDNEPLCGYLSALDEKSLLNLKAQVRKQCLLFDVDYKDRSLEELTKTICSLCYHSYCDMAVLPLQDLLALKSEKRLNYPSRLDGNNWVYRAEKKDFSKELADFILKNVTSSHRG